MPGCGVMGCWTTGIDNISPKEVSAPATSASCIVRSRPAEDVANLPLLPPAPPEAIQRVLFFRVSGKLQADDRSSNRSASKPFAWELRSCLGHGTCAFPQFLRRSCKPTEARGAIDLDSWLQLCRPSSCQQEEQGRQAQTDVSIPRAGHATHLCKAVRHISSRDFCGTAPSKCAIL